MSLMRKAKGVAVITVAAAGFHAYQMGAAAPAVTTALPGGTNLSTHAGWARALLAADSFPQTSCNLNAVLAWEYAEGGGFGNQASYNVLNVNPGPGAGWPGHNAIGAWAFPDAATGLRYTVAVLNSGYYGGIRAALHAGNDAQAVCNAIMASPWAESHYRGTLAASCSGAAGSA